MQSSVGSHPLGDLILALRATLWNANVVFAMDAYRLCRFEGILFSAREGTPGSSGHHRIQVTFLVFLGVYRYSRQDD